MSCSVDLSMSEISETTASDSTDEVFTTVIEASEEPEAPSGFSEFGFSEALLKTLADKGYKEPSPIQKAAIPELMLGRDLVGQAQTGTGKTAAFALPLLERLQGDSPLPSVLVLAPTRELAMQVADTAPGASGGAGGSADGAPPMPMLLYGTVNGVIGLIAAMPQEEFQFWMKVQEQLTRVIKGVGGFTHAAWRAFSTTFIAGFWIICGKPVGSAFSGG